MFIALGALDMQRMLQRISFFILSVLFCPLKHKSDYVVKLVPAIKWVVEQMISCIRLLGFFCPGKHCVLVCSCASSITRLCPQSNAAISCAWTCLYVPHGWQKGLLALLHYGVSTQRLPEKHHSGIFPLCRESITHEKSVCLPLLSGKEESRLCDLGLF